jgi:opacity protein-like surface antigen
VVAKHHSDLPHLLACAGLIRSDQPSQTRAENTVKRFLIALGLSTALIGAAQAADVHSKKGSLKDEPRAAALPEPTYPEERANWDRIWSAVVAGYSMVNTEVEISKTETFSLVDGLGAEGFFGEVQIGVDKQLGPVVLGVFGAVAYSDASFSAMGGTLEVQENESYLVMGRVGVPIGKASLVYVAGGYRWANFEVTQGGSGDKTVGGLVGETGLESKINSVLGWKAFVRYTDFEDVKIDDCLKLKGDELQAGVGLTISLGATPSSF